MKRKIASRKLKRSCWQCGCNFKKGDVYYLKRVVLGCDGYVDAWEELYCAKCKYRMEQRHRRYRTFKPHCHHPVTREVWSYIPGEAVMQPDHDECTICGKWF